MTARTAPRARRSPNGKSAARAGVKTVQGPPDEALQVERHLAERAAAIRGDATKLTQELFLELWPLLREPIPAGFIVQTPQLTGKPYESTGVKAVQVLIDRMDNVLTPLWWQDDVEYSEGGRLARVTITVGGEGLPLYQRSSMGGVDRGSTQGNIYKGSYTNAAKLAFARVGPGHEVYVGIADLDPDTNEAAAKEQAREPRAAAARPAPARTPEQGAALDELVALARDVVEKEVWTRKQLSAHLVAAGATDTSSVAAAIATLTPDQAGELLNTLLDLANTT